MFRKHVGYDPVGDFLVRADIEFLSVAASYAEYKLVFAVTCLPISACRPHALIELAFFQSQSLTRGITLSKILLPRQNREARNLDIATVVALFGNRLIGFTDRLVTSRPKLGRRPVCAPRKLIGRIVGGIERAGRDLPASLLVLLRPCG
jgi:hypothetical protein